MVKNSLRYGPVEKKALHVIVDMQTLFAAPGEFYCADIQDILPVILRLAQHKPAQTVFTRYIPREHPETITTQWEKEYLQWQATAFGSLPPSMFDLIDSLLPLSSSSHVIDKNTYSVFESPSFKVLLNQHQPSTLIFSGVKTNYCVLASVLASLDHNYRTIVVTDAVAGSTDATQKAVLETLFPRFTQQIELTTSDMLLHHWK